MPTVTCPACAYCGKPGAPPIRRIGGKLQGCGVATTIGAWWAPARLFPGIVIFVLGRFFEQERS